MKRNAVITLKRRQLHKPDFTLIPSLPARSFSSAIQATYDAVDPAAGEHSTFVTDQYNVRDSWTDVTRNHYVNNPSRMSFSQRTSDSRQRMSTSLESSTGLLGRQSADLTSTDIRRVIQGMEGVSRSSTARNSLRIPSEAMMDTQEELLQRSVEVGEGVDVNQRRLITSGDDSLVTPTADTMERDSTEAMITRPLFPVEGSSDSHPSGEGSSGESDQVDEVTGYRPISHRYYPAEVSMIRNSQFTDNHYEDLNETGFPYEMTFERPYVANRNEVVHVSGSDVLNDPEVFDSVYNASSVVNDGNREWSDTGSAYTEYIATEGE